MSVCMYLCISPRIVSLQEIGGRYLMVWYQGFIYRSLMMHYVSPVPPVWRLEESHILVPKLVTRAEWNLTHPETQAVWVGKLPQLRGREGNLSLANWLKKEETLLFEADQEFELCIRTPHTAFSLRFVKVCRVIWIQLCISYSTWCYFWKKKFQRFPFIGSTLDKQNLRTSSQRRHSALILCSVGITLFIFYWRKKCPPSVLLVYEAYWCLLCFTEKY